MSVVFRGRLALQAALFLGFAIGGLGRQAPPAADGLAEESHRARDLMAAHRFAEAVPIYEKLAKALPDNIGLRLNLALAEEMSGHLAESAPNFELVLKAQPESVPALISLAMVRLQLNQPSEAILLLKRLIKLKPGDQNALGMLADAETSTQQYEAASEHYRELALQDAKDPRAWFGLGKSYEALATRTFERLNKLAPESPYVAVLLADTRVQRHQYRSAFFFYHQAEQKLPDMPGVHAGLAQVYSNTDHSDWAKTEQKQEESVRAAACKNQGSAECAFTSGRLLDAAKSGANGASAADLFWATKAYNQLALDAFDHLTHLPDSVQLHALKAQILHDEKQDMEAAEEWKNALKLSPNDPNLQRDLALSLFEARDYQHVIPLVQEQLERSPKSPELNYLLGASLFRTEQPERALPYLRAGIQGSADVLPAEAALGLTLVALNKNNEAIPYLKKALPLDDDGSLHYSLARAYRAAGQTQLATQTMQQYQQIQKQNKQVNDELAKEAEITAPGQ